MASVVLVASADGKRKCFEAHEIDEAKLWLHERYIECKYEHLRGVEDYTLEELTAGEEGFSIMYEYNEEDFLPRDITVSLTCVDWLQGRGFISSEDRKPLIEALGEDEIKFVAHSFETKKRKRRE